MTPPIKRGTASRLGLRRQQYVDIYVGNVYYGRMTREEFDAEWAMWEPVRKWMAERMMTTTAAREAMGIGDAA